MTNLIFFLSFPIIAGAIGWFTNFIAVKMLFYPQNPVKVLFWEIQGIFPKRHHELAEKLADVVSVELFSVADLKKHLADADSIEKIVVGLTERLDHYLDVELPEKHPFINFLTSKKTKDSLRNEMVEKISILTPEMVNNYVENIHEHINIKKIVHDKVLSFSVDKMEGILQGILSKEFKFIELIGLVIGVIVGLVQVAMILIRGVY
ncbi:MAG: DUF445 family protein [Chitinophagales bacterium]|nr:DUF445 family protein [Bacteroidota bacterium]MCB9043705.1 DUF445 family protein [Chitinophagales bacterium]